MPAGSITQSLSLSCSSDCSPLTANVPEGDQYLYEWISEEGLVCGGENSPTAMIGAIGLYKFIVIDTLNNCADTSSTIVSADATAIIADPGPTRQIGCNNATVTLDGKGSTSNENTIFSWTNEAKEVVSTETTAEVSESGEYTLTVIDTLEGCIAIGRVAVTINTEMPIANAGDDLEIPGCDFPDRLRLNGANSDNGIGITYAWSASEGGQLIGDTTLANPEISSPGIFTLTVTNLNNGCSSTDEVKIASNLLIPTANAGPDRGLSCSESILTLAGLNEVPTVGGSVLWSTTDGNIIGTAEELNLQIDAPGTYILTISSSDGCTSTDEAVITANLEMQTAEAGESLSISCNQNTFINASGTTGDNIQITWASNDGNIISGADSYTPEVNLGGTYQLTVTNLDNNCTATSEVIILVDEELPLAEAGDNQEICRNETNLAAILPEG